jgi:eukaryotic-like serine/threonine-protein kinase
MGGVAPVDPALVHFTPERLLGSGGMGEVYLARGRLGAATVRVALKRPHLTSAEHLAAFEREAKVCQLLEHPNVVRIRAHGVDAHGPYLAFDYVEGASAAALLKAFTRADRPVPVAVVVHIAQEIGRALDYAHRLPTGKDGRLGVVHRDVSLDNVLLSFQGEVLLADFGVAKILGATSFTRTGGAKGKFGYMAPELLNGEPLDPRADLFSFGVCLYRLLCAVPPFRGESEGELVRAVLLSSAPPAASLRPEIPAALDQLIARCLQKDRNARPSSMAEVLEQLATLARGAEAGRGAVIAAMKEAFPQGVEQVLPPSLKRPSMAHPGTIASTRALRPRRAAWWALGALVFGVGSASGWYLARPGISTDAPLPPAATQASVIAESPSETSAVRGDTADGSRAPTAERTRPPRAVPRRPAVAEKAAPELATPAQATRLRIKVHPWAHVFLNGQRIGQTPLDPVVVPAGTHSLVLVNEELGVRRSYRVEAVAGQENTFKAFLP